MTQDALSDEATQVLLLLGSQATYDQIRERTGWSRGRIYDLAVKHGARKTEDRIRERHADRQRRQLEYLANIMNTTAQADVLDFLNGLPDASVQTILTSPPYNIGKAYGDGPSADSLRAVYYHGWLMQVLSECARILKPGGSLCLQLGSTRDWQQRLMPLDVLVYEDLRRTGLVFQSRVVWTARHGLTPRRRLADRYETILVWSNGPEPVFNPAVARVPQKEPGRRAFKGPNKGKLSGHPLGAWPTNVWSDITTIGHNHPDRALGAHPAQFPVALAKRAILLYSKAGDLVCDPFSGSGSTQIAAIETGRAFVGADLFYDDLRRRRLAATTADVVTPLPGVSDASVAVWQAEAKRVDWAAPFIAPEQEEQMLFDLFADGERIAVPRRPVEVGVRS